MISGFSLQTAKQNVDLWRGVGASHVMRKIDGVVVVANFQVLSVYLYTFNCLEFRIFTGLGLILQNSNANL